MCKDGEPQPQLNIGLHLLGGSVATERPPWCKIRVIPTVTVNPHRVKPDFRYPVLGLPRQTVIHFHCHSHTLIYNCNVQPSLYVVRLHHQTSPKASLILRSVSLLQIPDHCI